MNRRTVLAAPAAIATSTALPAVASELPATAGLDYDAIRARIAVVCETYSIPTGGFPEPMTLEEAQAAMSLTDDEINYGDAFLAFGRRWGVCFDWLVAGRMGALLHDGRELREAERAQRAARVAAKEDPALVAYQEWRDADDAYRAVALTGDDPSEEVGERESEALRKLADVMATTPAGLEAQILASFDIFGTMRRHGDPTNPDDYEFGWKDEVDGRMMRSILGGAARLTARETGNPPSYTPPQGKIGGDLESAEFEEFDAYFRQLDSSGKEAMPKWLRPMVEGDVAATEAGYRAFAELLARPVDEEALAHLLKATA